MTRAEIVLTRVNRTVAVTGANGAAPPPAAVSLLEEAFTCYERKFNYVNRAEGGSPIEITPIPLYARHPRTGQFTLPLGLRPRAVKTLAGAGYPVRYRSHPMAAPGSPAAALDWDGLFADFTVYPDQGEAISRLVGAEGGVFAGATGTGKSVQMRMICRLYHRAKIHVVTKSADLADEIYAGLTKVVPNVGFVGAGRKKFGRVTVFVADSLHHGMGEADLVLCDEIHELAAPSYAAALGRYTTARIFGFSATPTGRMDGRDAVVEAICGPLLYEMSYQDAQAIGRVVPITAEWVRVSRGPELGGITSLPLKEKKGIWANDQRNQVLADRIAKIPADDQVLVMVKTIEHAVRLKHILGPDYTLCYAANGMDVGRLKNYVRQGLLPKDEPLMTRDRIRALRTEFAAGTLKKVIANYVWSTGVDFRNLGVLVRADAAASEIRDGQIPGRVCRRVPGVKESALVIDAWDEWDGGFLRRSQSRRANYTKKGWTSVWADQPKAVGGAYA